ncbi:hypothetical protein AUK40_05030 [Candidatus Wirthbacteria bacterium CG2_30_54_11]|uniref:PIN domain-containing protein n=1 Tax=Candidatus Wirthbacteria bacterium CG2_30_54_11 TaxID=1817892 RepID=A0A1J5IPU7_9BACT|nr:MAG: hypothetical protein AUK40_05030 [Candidatus Wirthbacteria bacterium CG2_30_54_11]
MRPEYLIDTCVLIDHLRGVSSAVERLYDLNRSGRLAFAAITATEIYQGMREKEKTATDALLEGLVCIPFDLETGRLTGFLMKKSRREGLGMELGDAMIASTAMLHELTLVTANVRHFQIEGLKVRGACRSSPFDGGG